MRFILEPHNHCKNEDIVSGEPYDDTSTNTIYIVHNNTITCLSPEEMKNILFPSEEQQPPDNEDVWTEEHKDSILYFWEEGNRINLERSASRIYGLETYVNREDLIYLFGVRYNTIVLGVPRRDYEESDVEREGIDYERTGLGRRRAQPITEIGKPPRPPLTENVYRCFPASRTELVRNRRIVDIDFNSMTHLDKFFRVEEHEYWGEEVDVDDDVIMEAVRTAERENRNIVIAPTKNSFPIVISNTEIVRLKRNIENMETTVLVFREGTYYIKRIVYPSSFPKSTVGGDTFSVTNQYGITKNMTADEMKDWIISNEGLKGMDNVIRKGARHVEIIEENGNIYVRPSSFITSLPSDVLSHVSSFVGDSNFRSALFDRPDKPQRSIRTNSTSTVPREAKEVEIKEQPHSDIERMSFVELGNVARSLGINYDEDEITTKGLRQLIRNARGNVVKREQQRPSLIPPPTLLGRWQVLITNLASFDQTEEERDETNRVRMMIIQNNPEAENRLNALQERIFRQFRERGGNEQVLNLFIRAYMIWNTRVPNYRLVKPISIYINVENIRRELYNPNANIENIRDRVRLVEEEVEEFLQLDRAIQERNPQYVENQRIAQLQVRLGNLEDEMRGLDEDYVNRYNILRDQLGNNLINPDIDEQAINGFEARVVDFETFIERMTEEQLERREQERIRLQNLGRLFTRESLLPIPARVRSRSPIFERQSRISPRHRSPDLNQRVHVFDSEDDEPPPRHRSPDLNRRDSPPRNVSRRASPVNLEHPIPALPDFGQPISLLTRWRVMRDASRGFGGQDNHTLERIRDNIIRNLPNAENDLIAFENRILGELRERNINEQVLNLLRRTHYTDNIAFINRLRRTDNPNALIINLVNNMLNPNANIEELRIGVEQLENHTERLLALDRAIEERNPQHIENRRIRELLDRVGMIMQTREIRVLTADMRNQLEDLMSVLENNLLNPDLSQQIIDAFEARVIEFETFGQRMTQEQRERLEELERQDRERELRNREREERVGQRTERQRAEQEYQNRQNAIETFNREKAEAELKISRLIERLDVATDKKLIIEGFEVLRSIRAVQSMEELNALENIQRYETKIREYLDTSQRRDSRTVFDQWASQRRERQHYIERLNRARERLDFRERDLNFEGREIRERLETAILPDLERIVSRYEERVQQALQRRSEL